MSSLLIIAAIVLGQDRVNVTAGYIVSIDAAADTLAVLALDPEGDFGVTEFTIHIDPLSTFCHRQGEFNVRLSMEDLVSMTKSRRFRRIKFFHLYEGRIPDNAKVDVTEIVIQP